MPSRSDISAMIQQEAFSQGVDPGLALSVAQQESGLNQNTVGARREIGVFQLAPATAGMLGVDAGDLAQNIRGGVSYLGLLLKRYRGNAAAALAAYNAGPGRVDAAIQQAGRNWPSKIPSATVSYINRILSGIFSSTPRASQPVSRGAEPAQQTAPTTAGMGMGGVGVLVTLAAILIWVAAD